MSISSSIWTQLLAIFFAAVSIIVCIVLLIRVFMKKKFGIFSGIMLVLSIILIYVGIFAYFNVKSVTNHENYEKSIKMADIALKFAPTPKDRLEVYLNKIYSANYHKKGEDTIRFAEEAQKHSAEFKKSNFMRLVYGVYLYKGDYDSILENADEKSPYRYKAYIMLEKYPEALQELEKYLETEEEGQSLNDRCMKLVLQKAVEGDLEYNAFEDYIANSPYEQKALKQATKEYSELNRYSKVSEMVDGEWVEISYEQRKKEHEQRAKEYLPNRKKTLETYSSIPNFKKWVKERRREYGFSD